MSLPRPKEKCLVCGQEYTDEDMVQCDDCQRWFHFECVGVDESVSERAWSCTKCRMNKQTGSRDIFVEEKTTKKKSPPVPTDVPVCNLENAVALLVSEQLELEKVRKAYAQLKAEHELVTNEYDAVKRLLHSKPPQENKEKVMADQFRQAWEKRSQQSGSDHNKSDESSNPTPPERRSLDSRKDLDVDQEQEDPMSRRKPSELSQLAILMKQAHVEDLPKFAGDSKHWPLFLAVYKRTTALASIDDVTNVGRLTKALEGEARELVMDQLTYGLDPIGIIKTLERRYGKKDVVLKTLTTELLDFPVLSGQKDPKLQKFAVSLKTYVAQLKSLGLERNLKSDLVEALLLDKLENIPSMYRKWKSKKCDNDNLDIKDFASFVLQEWECLPPSVTNTEKRNNTTQGHSKSYSRSLNVHAAPGSSRDRCLLCDRTHPTVECFRFKKQDVSERWKAVTRAKLCFGCLNSNDHRAADCSQKIKCPELGCDKFHHRLLHSPSYANSSEMVLNVNAGEFEPSQPTNQGQTQSQANNHQTHVKDSIAVTAKVVPVRILGVNGTVVNDYAFLDDGSTITMMNEEIAKKLGIEGEKEQLILQWTKGITRVEEAKRCDVTLAGAKGKEKFNLRGVYCVPNLELSPTSQQGSELAKRYRHLKGLPLPNFSDVRPGILIGLEHATMLGGKHVYEGEINEPLASKTKLGWIVYGRHDSMTVEASAARYQRQEFQQCHLRLGKRHNDDDQILHELVKGFFGIESVGFSTSKLRCAEDKRAEEIMKKTLKFVNGRYEIGLLWKTDNEQLPSNVKMAEKRLKSEEKKLKRDPESLDWMNEHVRKLIIKNYAREATLEDLHTKWERTWICPLFTVINRNKIPPKRRCVADVAAEEQGISLNSCLMKGPDNLIALPAALCRARENPVMVTADVAEMFHQVRISKEDQQVQRFLWRDGDDSIAPKMYLMQAMMFGPTCSPSQAQFVKNQHAEKYRERYPEAVEALVRFMYMDDYFNSHQTIDEAVRVTSDAIKICSEMGFDLIQVQSSHEEVLRSLPQRHLKPELVNLNIDETSAYVTKLLGMYWNPMGDAFEFKRSFDDLMTRMTEFGDRPTKREALSTLMKIFDPLGLISKYVVRGKWILQDIWRERVEWDEKIPENLADEWLRFLKTFDEIEKIKIPRWYGGKNSNLTTELIIFVDASKKAYAAVGYFRFVNEGAFQVTLAMAKTKVAPVKPQSIPRLELEAARLGTRLAGTIAELHSFDIARRYFLSDSRCVLHQINSRHFKYDTFVAHRLGEISERSAPEEWWHVSTSDNVADDATKENESTKGEAKSRWFDGPKFLRLPVEDWPISRVDHVDCREVQSRFHALAWENDQSEHFIHSVGWRFKCKWQRLVRVTARVMRVREKLHKHRSFDDEVLEINELEHAEKEIFRLVQKETLFEHWKEISSETTISGKGHGMLRDVKGTQNLALFFRPEERIIRVESRERIVSGSYAEKNRILLPKDHQFVQLFLQYLHEKNFHMGIETTIAEARERVWIVSLRQALATTISKCQHCKIRRARPIMPTMGTLHESRAAFDQKPFSFVGVDCFGPMMVKEKRSEVKRWGVIFTCLTYRAVHLEIVQDLSSDQMLLAVRRLVARRGQVRTLFSDNGTNFRGAANVLLEEIREAQKVLKRETIRRMNLEWRFIPAYSPWMGGAWERLIGYIKRCIKFCLSGETPSDTVLQNTLIEAELLTNKRPLTHTPIDPDDEEPLSPNIALFGTFDATQALCPNEQRNKFARLSRRRVAHLVEKFRQRWEKEYLPVIAKAEMSLPKQRKVEIGDVVLLTEGEDNRDLWKLGRITRVHPSSDNIPRIVDLKMGTGEMKFRRAVGNLAVLEVGKSNDQ